MINTETSIVANLKAINIFNVAKKQIPPIPNSIWTNPLHFIAFGFGAGAFPIAPGTVGTLFAIPFYLVLQPLDPYYYLIFVLFFIVISSWICDRVSKTIGVHDHPGMCLDEFAGYFVTMIAAPKGFLWVALGFIFFRLFDIWKPGIIKMLDRKIQGGVGIVLDDVLAGLFAFTGLQIIVLALNVIH